MAAHGIEPIPAAACLRIGEPVCCPRLLRLANPADLALRAADVDHPIDPRADRSPYATVRNSARVKVNGRRRSAWNISVSCHFGAQPSDRTVDGQRSSGCWQLSQRSLA